MKRIFTLFLSFFLYMFSSAQFGLPVTQSLLPKNNLVVNYDFSKSSGFTRGSATVTNLAGTASGNATLFNAPIFFNSLGYVSFNGSNQYLATPNLKTYFKSVNATVQKSFTMSFWFYPTVNTGVLVSELDSQTPNTGWHATNIELINAVINFRVWSSATPVTSSTITLNQWHHVAMVYDGTSFKGYLDGILQGTQSFAREIPSASQNYAIGAGEATNIGTGAYGNFSLAQFKLHNLPLSDKDVLLEYNLRKNEFDYSIHSPSTNSNPTYWSISSAWNSSTGSTGASDPFGYNHYTPWLNSGLGWAAQVLDTSTQYITLSYDEPAYVKGIVIQPRAASGNQYLTKVNIETSNTGGAPWNRVLTGQVLGTSITDDASIIFPSSIFTKAIKIIPVLYNNHMTARLGMLVKPNNIVKNGLTLNLDAANIKSYQGTGSTFYDLTTNFNNATLYGSPTFTSAGGDGLNFNGSTQYGSIPSVSNITDFTNTQKYSIEVWFNPSSGQTTSTEAELLEKWNKNNESRYPFTIRYNESTSSMLVACYDGTTFKSISISGFPVNSWKQLVAVFDFVNLVLTVYKDGTSAGSVSLSGVNQVSNTSPIAICSRLTSNSYQSNIMFKGVVGVIRIYNTALSNTDVTQNYNSTKIRYSIVQDGLVANLINPPSSGSTWNDASAYGNNATINGSPTYTSNNGGGYTTSSTSYISIPYNLTNTYTVSIACSLNPSTFWATLWGNETWNATKGYLAYLTSNTSMNFGSPSGSSNITLSGINTVHIWDFVVNGTSYTLYKDGLSFKTGTIIAPSGGMSTNGLYFGARHTNAGTLYTDICTGTYYSMRVYNRNLSATEIATNFNALRGYYGL